MGRATSKYWPAKGDVVRIRTWGSETEPVKLLHIRHEAPEGPEARVERWAAETIPESDGDQPSRLNVLVSVQFEEGGDGGTTAIV